MGRVRIRSAKGKRWQKGQSSSSNPQTNKHRNVARGKFGSHLSQWSSTQPQGVTLTADALASHDAIQRDRESENGIQLNRSVVLKIYGWFLTRTMSFLFCVLVQ